MVYPALLPLMRTPRLPVVDWTDASADLNGLVRFVERQNMVSARVPSHFNSPLRYRQVQRQPLKVTVCWDVTFFMLLRRYRVLSKTLPTYSSSSIGTTAHCGLWLVEKCPSNFPICHQLCPSSHSQHLKISFYFLFPSFPRSSHSSRPFQFLVKIFLDILSSFIVSRWPNQLVLCHFIQFIIFSPLLVSSSSWFVGLFHSPFSYLGTYILLNIFLSKIGGVYSSFFVNNVTNCSVKNSRPFQKTALVSTLHKNYLLPNLSLFIVKRIS